MSIKLFTPKISSQSSFRLASSLSSIEINIVPSSANNLCSSFSRDTSCRATCHGVSNPRLPYRLLRPATFEYADHWHYRCSTTSHCQCCKEDRCRFTSPGPHTQQRFQRLQVVAVYDFVVALRRCPVAVILRPKPVLVFQHPIRYIVMMIDYFIFSYPSQCRHSYSSTILGSIISSLGFNSSGVST